MILSICIPTYNRKESLYYCLKSLAKQTTKEFEVCISDNSSNYNIKELLKPFKKKLNLKVNINNCYSIGDISVDAGGIVGSNCGSGSGSNPK